MTPPLSLSVAQTLPSDGLSGTLVGRAWIPATPSTPRGPRRPLARRRRVRHFRRGTDHQQLGREVRLISPQYVAPFGPITATAIVAAVGDARQFRVICRFGKSRSNLVRHHTQLPNATCLFELSRCLATGSTCIAQWIRPATRSISCCGRIATRLLRAATSRRPSMVDQRGPVAQQDGIAQDEISQSHVIP
jgi:hypothetical protein